MGTHSVNRLPFLPLFCALAALSVPVLAAADRNALAERLVRLEELDHRAMIEVAKATLAKTAAAQGKDPAEFLECAKTVSVAPFSRAMRDAYSQHFSIEELAES